MDYKKEPLGGEIFVFTSREHSFGHDALLLADFAMPKPRESACDLGCGCGAIPLLWFARGEAAGPRLAYGVELQEQAVEQFSASVAVSGLMERVFPVCADLREYGRGQSASLDLVTCNPPYKAAGSGKTSHAPAARTARHETACTFADICAAAARLLKNAGRFCICQKPERLPELFEELRRHKLEPKRLRLVHKDAQSPAWLALIEARRGARPGLIAENPLLING